MPTKTWAVGEEVLAADFNTMVQRQVVATFPNAAARDAAIVAPAAGMACHLADVAGFQVYNGTTWKTQPAGLLVTTDYTATSGNVTNTATAIPTFSVTFTMPAAGRRVRVSVTSLVLQTGAAGMVRTYVRETSTDLVVAFTPTPAVNGYYTVTAQKIISPGAGAHTYQVWLSTDAGTVSVQGGTGTCSLTVEDVGT